jgi:hypothetical protein
MQNVGCTIIINTARLTSPLPLLIKAPATRRGDMLSLSDQGREPARLGLPDPNTMGL